MEFDLCPCVVQLPDFGAWCISCLGVGCRLSYPLPSAALQIGAFRPFVSFALALLQLLVAAARLVSYSVQMTQQTKQGNGVVRRLGPLSVFTPYALSDVFMIFNMVSSCFVIALFCLTYSADPFKWRKALNPAYAAAHKGESWEDNHDTQMLEAWAIVAAFTTGMLWIQMAEIFKSTTKLSALLFAISAVLADVLRFVLVLAVWLFGFSLMIYWLFVGANLETGYLDLFEVRSAPAHHLASPPQFYMIGT